MIQEAYRKDEPTVQVCLRGDVFVIDLITKTGSGQRTGEHITLSRNWMVSSTDQAGIPLPGNWEPMAAP
ncbi:hypothetical protein OS493_035528 [Desmophyllum pertusum]|uniref:Uncharacterized protein n=1 Tax=Desmophyllum pertusum TaxID=174260 RepID=A0A9W9YIS9_9CNID|nr:hypothetical protein OS493_035528 [Desmophyllum pertusum]